MSTELSDETIKNKCRQLLAASALVPVLCALSQPPNFKALIYSVFVVNYLIHSREKNQENQIASISPDNNLPGNKIVETVEFLALFTGAGMMVQLFDLVGYFCCSNRVQQWVPWLNFSQVQIAQTDYFYQFAMSGAYLATIALVFLFALKIFLYSYRQAVLTAAAFGAVTVLGFVLVPSFTELPADLLDIVTASLASAVYWASIVGIALTPLHLKLAGAVIAPAMSLPRRLIKYLTTIALLVVAMVIWKLLAHQS